MADEAVHVSKSLWVQGDLMIVRVAGMLDAAEVAIIDGESDRIAAAYGYCLCVVDARTSTGMTAEARRAHAGWARQHRDRLSCTALFGASPALTAMSRLLERAVMLVTQNNPLPVRMVRDEPEALTLLAGERERLRDKARARGHR